MLTEVLLWIFLSQKNTTKKKKTNLKLNYLWSQIFKHALCTNKVEIHLYEFFTNAISRKVDTIVHTKKLLINYLVD